MERSLITYDYPEPDEDTISIAEQYEEYDEYMCDLADSAYDESFFEES